MSPAPPHARNRPETRSRATATRTPDPPAATATSCRRRNARPSRQPAEPVVGQTLADIEHVLDEVLEVNVDRAREVHHVVDVAIAHRRKNETDLRPQPRRSRRHRVGAKMIDLQRQMMAMLLDRAGRDDRDLAQLGGLVDFGPGQFVEAVFITNRRHMLNAGQFITWSFAWWIHKIRPEPCIPQKRPAVPGLKKARRFSQGQTVHEASIWNRRNLCIVVTLEIDYNTAALEKSCFTSRPPLRGDTGGRFRRRKNRRGAPARP